jgi:membrane-bound lytic murein transglycosylase D
MSPRLRLLPALLACLLAGTTTARAALPTGASLAAGDGPAAPGATLPSPAAKSAPVDAPLGGPGAAPTNPAPSPAIAPVASAPLPPGADPEAEAAALAGVPATSPLPVGTEPLAQSVTRGDEVFARIRRNLAGNACLGGGNTERWRRRYAANPAAFAHRLEQILPLLDFVSAEVERVGLPSEFVFIPLVESWYKPEAIGANGPAGMWQMIGSTARNHGIHIQPGYDGRLSPVESTRAALSYLKTLQNMFGNWQATVMAYNAGEGRLMQAYKRARSREANGEGRRPHGLSNITYDYVGKLQALSCLVTQPERHGLKLPRGSRFIPLAPVLMEPRITSIEQFATQRGRNANELRRLNPGFTGGRVVAGVPRLVLMPLGVPQGDVIRLEAPPMDAVANALAATAMAEAQAAEAGAPIEPAALEATSTLASVAGAPQPVPVAVPVAVSATAAEPAPGRSPANVVLPTAASATASAPASATASGATTPAPPKTHRVVSGDSLSTIAARYRVSIAQLRELNHVGRGDLVRPGDELRLAP